MPTFAYYVSGHGFGHARRTAQVIRAIRTRRPDVRVVVRTAAPASIFAGIDDVTVSAPRVAFDPGVVERDTLTVDGAASMRRLAEVLARRDEIVAVEAAFLREIGAGFVAADIPFLAGDAARAAGLRCVAVGNFTWDWIFEPYATTAADRELIREVRASYAKFDALLQLPLGHRVDRCFREVVPMPLVAGRPVAGRAAALAALGISADDRRPRVLVAMRGGLSDDVLRAVAGESPDVVFVAAHTMEDAPGNLSRMPAAAGLDFTDVLAACDAVVSKVGYGILSDCIANGAALLYPPRVGFREDEVTTRECPRYMRMRELAAGDVYAGRWRGALLELLASPPADERMDTAGDVAVAGEIVRRTAR
jgi:L-arabinokinase